MMKNHHLKMYIDRLMMVPNKPKAGGEHTPINHPGAKLPNEHTDLLGKEELGDGAKGHGGHGDLEDLHDKDMDLSGLAHAIGRDTMKDDDASIHDERDDMFAEHEGKMNPVADHDDEENVSMHSKGKGGHKPQSVTEPHSLKEGNLNSYDHEKRVKMERARHARIFGE